MIIAIDGTAASGKGSLAKNLSKSLNLHHLDTGIFYRVLAYQAIKLKINNKIDLIELSNNLSINKIIEIKKLKSVNLRSTLISEKSSQIAAEDRIHGRRCYHGEPSLLGPGRTNYQYLCRGAPRRERRGSETK